MTIKEWIFEIGTIENPYYPGQWKLLHILTLVFCALSILAIFFIFKKAKNKEKTRKIILIILASSILFFEVVCRIVFFIRLYYFHVPDMEGWTALKIIIPKPWCAIACWSVIACPLVNKKFFYNYTSITGLLCTIIFFIYPGVGFNNVYIVFRNVYSIATHALLLISAVSLMTLKFTEFKYKEIWKVFVCLAATYIYALIEVYILKTERDPLYFMPHGDIQEGILGIPWGLYITLYIIVILVYINVFYLIGDRKNIFKKKEKVKK